MSSARTLRWMLMAPALLLGAFVYWTLALGLGALSLTALQGVDVELMSQALPLAEPSDADVAVPCEEAVDLPADAPTSDMETIPVEVVGSREYTPGATAF